MPCQIAATCRTRTVYVADGYGSLYPEQVDHLVKLYQAKLPGVTIGFSGRNNLQVAFSNTVHAIIEGCNMVEGSILGLGLGAGEATARLSCARQCAVDGCFVHSRRTLDHSGRG